MDLVARILVFVVPVAVVPVIVIPVVIPVVVPVIVVAVSPFFAYHVLGKWLIVKRGFSTAELVLEEKPSLLVFLPNPLETVRNASLG